MDKDGGWERERKEGEKREDNEICFPPPTVRRTGRTSCVQQTAAEAPTQPEQPVRGEHAQQWVHRGGHQQRERSGDHGRSQSDAGTQVPREGSVLCGDIWTNTPGTLLVGFWCTTAPIEVYTVLEPPREYSE